MSLTKKVVLAGSVLIGGCAAGGEYLQKPDAEIKEGKKIVQLYDMNKDSKWDKVVFIDNTNFANINPVCPIRYGATDINFDGKWDTMESQLEVETCIGGKEVKTMISFYFEDKDNDGIFQKGKIKYEFSEPVNATVDYRLEDLDLDGKMDIIFNEKTRTNQTELRDNFNQQFHIWKTLVQQNLENLKN